MITVLNLPDYIGDNHLSQGCGRQRGNTDAAAIIIAVLIIVPGTSAAIAPLLSTRRNPRWFAVSGFVRVIPPYVLPFSFRRSFLLSAQRKYNSDTDYPNFQHLATAFDCRRTENDCYPCRIARLRYEIILNYANVKQNRAMRRKRTPGIPPDVRPLKSTIKMILTAISYAKLTFYSHLHNRITTRQCEKCD